MFHSLYLSSSPCAWPPPPDVDAPFLLREEEGFLASLHHELGSRPHLLMIAAAPDDTAFNDRLLHDFGDAFRASGWPGLTSHMLDRRNTHHLSHLLQQADLVLLCGGHVPTQNRFFMGLDLKDHLQAFSGIVLGISAGSMNASKTVYALPEEPGESLDPDYRRFLPGLGLTDLHILPHLNENHSSTLDGKRLYEDIALADSRILPMLAIPDGSYVLSKNGQETLYGEGYLLQQGTMTRISSSGHVMPLLPLS